MLSRMMRVTTSEPPLRVSGCHAEPDHGQHRRDQHQTGAADHETSYRPGHPAPRPRAPPGRAPAACSGHVMLPRLLTPWLGPSPALLARLFAERYECRPPWGITRRCLPGGMPPSRRALTRRCYPAGRGAVSGDQAELPGPGDSLGAVGGAEL